MDLLEAIYIHWWWLCLLWSLIPSLMIALLENLMLAIKFATFQVRVYSSDKLIFPKSQLVLWFHNRFDSKIDLALWTNFSSASWQFGHVWFYPERNAGFGQYQRTITNLHWSRPNGYHWKVRLNFLCIKTLWKLKMYIQCFKSSPAFASILSKKISEIYYRFVVEKWLQKPVLCMILIFFSVYLQR